MRLLYENFKGLVPRIDKHLIEGSHAQKALDVNLWHGTLKPFREKALCHAISQDTKSVFFDNCCWKTYDKCVDFVRLNTTCKRQVITGLFDYPAGACATDCNPKWVRLGLPCPGKALLVESLTPLKTPDCKAQNFIDAIDYDRVSRVYVYTYVNSCCDESSPSYPSEVIDIDDGGRVLISGFERPSPEYDVTHIRIYRVASGFDKSNTTIDNILIDEKNEISAFYLVAEIPITQSAYIDDLKDYELGSALETQEYTEPPKNLTGIIPLKGVQLAGYYDGNKIRLSMPNYPHVWQEADELTIPDKILALVPLKNDIIVLTCGAIYKVEPIPNCDTVGCRRVGATIEDYPLISCCHRYGYTVTPEGVAFVSSHGIILTNGDTAKNITSSYFAPDDWQALHPDRLSITYHRDSIYIFSDEVGYCLQFPVSMANWVNSHLIELSDRPKYAFSEREELFLVENDGVYRWGAGDKFRPYEWVSKTEISPTQVNFAGVKVSRYTEGNLEFSFIGDNSLIKHYTIVDSDKLRLPSGRRDTEFKTKLTGTAEVYRVEISTSYRELGTI